MNQDQSKSPQAASGRQAVDPGRKRWLYPAVLVIALALVGVLVAGKRLRRPELTPESSAAQEQAAETQAQSQSNPTGGMAQPDEVALREAKPSLAEGEPRRTSKPGLAPAQPELPRTEPTPLTRQLVTGLTQLDLRGGVISAEQTAQWKQGMQQLVQQGAAAVPAIREFLEKNLDMRFEGVQGGNVAGYPSLRAGLFDALLQIGGPEAIEVSRQVLRTTADPLEIALLARNLEQQAPGQYRQEALDAARQSLELAARDKGNTRDVAPLFQMFQNYGDTGLLTSLQQTLPKWSYYATLAMAGLPDGQGVPQLINQVQDRKSSDATTVNLALQLLAQASAQYPEAGTALVEQARLNQIPDLAWQQIGFILGGDQLRFGSQFVDNTLPPAVGSGIRSYHIEYGNQNFYTTPSGATASPEQINQRRALIDQLLGITSNRAAVTALQAARNALPGGASQP